jgi:hypothetical protein
MVFQRGRTAEPKITKDAIKITNLDVFSDLIWDKMRRGVGAPLYQIEKFLMARTSILNFHARREVPGIWFFHYGFFLV